LSRIASRNNTKTADNLSNSFALFTFFSVLTPCTRWCNFFFKGHTAYYIHPVTTAVEARSARKRALDRKRAEACDTPATLNRCGHFDERYVAALKGTCLITFSFCFSYFSSIELSRDRISSNPWQLRIETTLIMAFQTCSAVIVMLCFGTARGSVVHVEVKTLYTIVVARMARFLYLRTDHVLSRWHRWLALAAVHHASDS
jgi:hypothetical protein